MRGLFAIEELETAVKTSFTQIDRLRQSILSGRRHWRQYLTLHLAIGLLVIGGGAGSSAVVLQLNGYATEGGMEKKPKMPQTV